MKVKSKKNPVMLFNLRKSERNSRENAMPLILDYWDFREEISTEMLKSNQPPSIDYMFNLAVSRHGVAPDIAAEHVARFMLDLHRDLNI